MTISSSTAAQWLNALLNVIGVAGKAMGSGQGATTAAPPATTTAGLTAVGLDAFIKMTKPLYDIVEGRGTIADDQAAINAVLDAVALIDPAGAPFVATAEAAEPFALAFFARVKASGAAGAAPRSGPPMTEADWSHGFPKPQPVDNPSGAIGGD